MAYPAISAHRMPYDIDGTEVATRGPTDGNALNSFSQGMASWLTSTQKGNLNAEARVDNWNYGNDRSRSFWFFFPELREVAYIGLEYSNGSSLPTAGDTQFILQGSPDSTNGMDGTWETGTYTAQHSYAADAWRGRVFAVSFSGPIKCLRLAVYKGYTVTGNLNLIHVYGEKAAGQTPDDLVFCDAAGNVLTALSDWGDQPEGTTEIDSFKVKNVSADKIANAINLQLNHNDFTISWSADGPWTTVLDIATLGIGALSNTVYVKNALGPPLLTLGPYAARVIATVGSWS